MQRVLINKMDRLGVPDVTLVGPAPCFFRRLRGRYRWQIILRGQQPERLLSDIVLPLGWRVDVDPVSVL
jgi:primosomal protein N' (replication factor Y)